MRGGLVPALRNVGFAFMTRSHKANDRDHAGLANGTALPEEHLPRYFAKSGFTDVDPKKVKKEGGGKGNWGHPGSEAQDTGYNIAGGSRRRSNSTTTPTDIADFKTKFELEDDPVFEEALHGPLAEEEDTAESTSGGSIEEEEGIKKV
ncbi:hypothetical protein MMC10_000322 [Thelotrema lepadinum]|nr:hypothetical protein [Thelotrema lepadinum]